MDRIAVGERAAVTGGVRLSRIAVGQANMLMSLYTLQFTSTSGKPS